MNWRILSQNVLKLTFKPDYKHDRSNVLTECTNFFIRKEFSTRPLRVLGIETSCDDTGAAVLSENGTILGECVNSQTIIHNEIGGIIPPVARDLHYQNIKGVVDETLSLANVSAHELDAIAVTNEPGLIMSLGVGTDFAKKLGTYAKVPLIPIHHMEAHALTARMVENIEFPFLVLLISGGHALLSVVKGVDDFLLLGKGNDDAPGDAFDKTARRLQLKNNPDCCNMSGGQAIEHLAKYGDPLAFDVVQVMSHHLDCNFSFSGLKASVNRLISEQEVLNESVYLSKINDICASFQYWILLHLAKRLQRAFVFCEMKNLLPDTSKTLVVSGGVASNLFIRKGLENLCSVNDFKMVCPPPKLCTDNGVMIAWNGIEKLKVGYKPITNFESISIKAKSPLGIDITQEVRQSHIKNVKLKII